MTEPLLDLVNAELLPAIAPLGFRVVESSVADVFDNASVVVQALDVRVEVVRDRGIVMFKIGPVTEPATSYDPGLLLNYLGLSSIDGYGGPDARSVLRGVGAFTKSMFNELRTMFGPQHLAQTKKDLNALAEERAARLFGG
jgi:hypothetical protein